MVPSKPKRILIVDDNLDILRLVAKMLGDLDSEAELVTCSSAETAINHVSKTQFDVVVCDYGMPQKTGTHVLSAMKSQASGALFVMFSSHPESAIEREYEEFTIVGKADFAKLRAVVKARLRPATEQ